MTNSGTQSIEATVISHPTASPHGGYASSYVIRVYYLIKLNIKIPCDRKTGLEELQSFRPKSVSPQVVSPHLRVASPDLKSRFAPTQSRFAPSRFAQLRVVSPQLKVVSPRPKQALVN